MLEDVSAGHLDAPAEVTLSIVAPVYGCGATLAQLVDEAAAAAITICDSFEVVLVDDASPDGAWATIVALAADRPWLRGLRLSRNFGQHAAIYAGISRARGEWVVVMDCDLQDPPAAIPELYRAAVDQGFDVVFAQRQDRQDSRRKRFSSWLFYRVLAWLTGVAQDPSIANFGIYSRAVIAAVAGMPERERAFPLMVKWAGFRQTAVPVAHAARAQGQSSYTLGKLLRLAMGIALSYSDKLLRMVAAGGLVCGLIAFVLVAAVIVSLFTGQITVAGYTSLMASVWLVGGLVLVSLGVVGLYVGQVFRNVQGRPTAIIAETV